MRPDEETFEYHEPVTVLKETGKAIMFTCSEQIDHWVPKSQISDDSEVFAMGDQGALIVSDWFATRAGWG